MSHTPGPWSFYDDSNDGKTNRIEIVAVGKTVARIYHSVPEEDLPNARLIAAAPKLLEALKRIEARVSYYAGLAEGSAPNIEQWAYTDTSGDMAIVRAAIKEATGGTV